MYASTEAVTKTSGDRLMRKAKFSSHLILEGSARGNFFVRFDFVKIGFRYLVQRLAVFELRIFFTDYLLETG
jgi:hypothetical protein